jgi:Uma2 family endonuclease
MPLVRRVHRYTYADYVGVEVASPTGKHEFIDGEIYAMAGGTETHSRLSAEVLRLLGNALVDGPCQVQRRTCGCVGRWGWRPFPTAP